MPPAVMPKRSIAESWCCEMASELGGAELAGGRLPRIIHENLLNVSQSPRHVNPQPYLSTLGITESIDLVTTK